jgi:lysophospholipase L1-like esterase
VAEVSRHFVPPWAGKFSVDNFHPSQDGYRDWSRALVEALGTRPAAAAALPGAAQAA